jgi:hypothetical protein
METIMEVTEVKLAILESFPPQLSIHASGLATTTGWSNPQLMPYETLVVPPDGIYDFDFVAARPTGIVADHVTRIEAGYTMKPLPETLKGVRVHASQNSKTVMLDTGQSEEPNQYTFDDRKGGRHITYYPKAPGPLIQGEQSGAELDYKGPEGQLRFRGGDKVRLEQNVFGTLISVTIKINADAGGLDFALILPSVHLAGETTQKFQTIGIMIHSRGRVANPAGADRSYEAIPLDGLAEYARIQPL